MRYWVNEILERELCSISVSQVLKIKTHYQNGTLSKSIPMDLLCERKEVKEGLQIDSDRLRGYFPKEYTIKQCEDLLWKILEEWKRKTIV